MDDNDFIHEKLIEIRQEVENTWRQGQGMADAEEPRPQIRLHYPKFPSLSMQAEPQLIEEFEAAIAEESAPTEDEIKETCRQIRQIGFTDRDGVQHEPWPESRYKPCVIEQFG
jgi:hypothetical protein